jgi:hypothetical protein
MTSTRGAAGRISRDDIEAKFREVQGEVDIIEDDARNYLGIAAIVVVVSVVAVAFVLGRRRGRSGRTVVEIRRV